MKQLDLVVISDLHCHPTSKGLNDTYLITDKLRSPIKDHPVESLKEIIKKENLTTNLTLCPGDFTNKSDRQGLIDGWAFCLEIHAYLKGDDIIATIGNHDVDVFQQYSNYSFENAKGISRGFPIDDEASCQTFWAKGCVFVEKENWRMLVINSSHFHHDSVASGHGQISHELIDYVENYLKDKNDNKIFLALAHHHPIDHSRTDLGEKDKIVNSDRLLEILGENRVDLFVHGHKHDPLLRYYQCHSTNYRIPILASGSFSATTNHIYTQQRNHFHRIHLKKEGKSNCVGLIKTWTFFPKNGWKINSDQHGFDSYTGFGYNGKIQDLAERIRKIVGSSPLMEWKKIRREVPEVDYLVPTESRELTIELEKMAIVINPRLADSAHYVSFTGKNLSDE